MLVLSLFPGIGLLDRAFEDEGYCVVRGPDVIWGGDIKRFSPPSGIFTGIIGGPPCQKWSRLQHIVRHNRKKAEAAGITDKYQEAEDLIPEFVRVIAEARPVWWLMENTPDVPECAWPQPSGYHVSTLILNQRWVTDATPQNRERRFWFGNRDKPIRLEPYLDIAIFEPSEFEYAVTAAGSTGGAPVPIRLSANGKPKRLPKNLPISRSVADYARLQGLPEDFLADAPFTVAGKKRVIGNGVPIPLGRAVARAVRDAIEGREAGR